jgi:hypothetical protein
MAAVTKGSNVSLCTPLPNDSNKIGPLLVGEDIAAGDACYIKTSDGKIYRSVGSAAAAAAECDGFAPVAALVAQRQTLSLFHDVNMNYAASGLSPGTYLWLSTTVAGGLDTASNVNQTKPFARVIDATRIRALRTY